MKTAINFRASAPFYRWLLVKNNRQKYTKLHAVVSDIRQPSVVSMTIRIVAIKISKRRMSPNGYVMNETHKMHRRYDDFMLASSGMSVMRSVQSALKVNSHVNRLVYEFCR